MRTRDGAETRIDKLYRIIEQSRYSVHDLSRTELDPINNLPRFNMPLELGIFLGAKRFGNEVQKKKRCLILDIAQFRYQMFISDLAGMDITAHGGDPATMVSRLRNWLATVSKRKTIPSPALAADSYQRFTLALPDLCEQAGIDAANILFADYERLVLAWVQADHGRAVPA
ncbi:nucleotide-binding protein [Mesorhizobium sp. WSM3868]|uniref:nucleotide-binding protein n=1 Tax=Mesorhizobium sp. WSM3868 TaxID=2029405 RepID=UPI001FDF040E|nr:nucleotide-binding protein [Mesorhizobium sp. WSM3868]